MWPQLAITLLVATSRAHALTAQEASQFTTAGGCTPAVGVIGAELVVNYMNGTTTIKANHIPDHEWGNVNPNTPTAPTTHPEYTFNPPDNQPDDKVGCLSLGPIGIAKNGVYIFNPTTGTGSNAKFLEEMDHNGGHTAPFGEYHYHFLPDNGIVWDSKNPESQFVGIAFDGNPIYSIGNGINVRDLDICHGLTVGGVYRYIASPDHFPYFLGCYRGTVQVKGRRPIRTDSCDGVTRNKACTCEFSVIQSLSRTTLWELTMSFFTGRTGEGFIKGDRDKKASCGTTIMADPNERPGPPPGGNGGVFGSPPGGNGGFRQPQGGNGGFAQPQGGYGGFRQPQGGSGRFGQPQGGNGGFGQPQGGYGQPQQGNNVWFWQTFYYWFGRRPSYGYRPPSYGQNFRGRHHGSHSRNRGGRQGSRSWYRRWW